jgi:predicted nucleic acid-binding protein
MKYTIDASVWINSCNPKEAGHIESSKLLNIVSQQKYLIICPTLLLVEVSSALSRGSKDTGLGYKYALAMTKIINLDLKSLDVNLALIASDIASNTGMRGADAVYCAISKFYKTTLITRDKTQYDKSRLAFIQSMYPEDILSFL